MRRLLEKDKVLNFGVAGIIFWILLYPKFPLVRIPGSQVSLRLEDLLMAGMAVVWIWVVWKKWKVWAQEEIMRAVVLYWMTGLLSLMAAILITKTVVPLVGLLHWARRVEYMIALFIGMTAINTKKDLRFFIKCLLIAMVYIFVFAVGQKHFGWPVITTQNVEYAKGIALRYIEGGHVISTFAGHYDLATFIILVMPVFFTTLFASTRSLAELGLSKKKWLSRGGLVLTTLVGMWLLVNAASRISIASYLGAVTVGLFLVRRYKIVPFVWIVSILFIGMSSNLVDRYMRIIKVTADKVVEVIETKNVVMAAQEGEVKVAEPIFEDRSTSIRFKVEWPRALRAVRKNPILGTGYSSIGLATDNDYLRMAGEVGLMGIAAFGLVIIRVFREMWKIFPMGEKIGLQRAFVAGVIGSMVGIGLNMVFIDVMEASKFALVFWLIIGMAVSTARLVEYEK